jgi:small subunit ribosomal protein S20
MPHNQSAKKRLRQNEERRVRNKARLTELKTIRKQLLRAIHDGQADKVPAIYQRLTKRVDQAASLRTVHPNAAARIKSRLGTQVNKFLTAPAAPAAK